MSQGDTYHVARAVGTRPRGRVPHFADETFAHIQGLHDHGPQSLPESMKYRWAAVACFVAVEPWRVPIPAEGAALRLASGGRWRYGLAHADAVALAHALAAAGAPVQESAPSGATAYARARLAVRRGRLDHPLVKFVLFPLLLALPAFRLHQHIAYGSTFGEYYSFGLAAYLTTFALWWAAWAIGVVLFAAALRAVIEAGTLTAVWWRPASGVAARRVLEACGRAALYLSLPGIRRGVKMRRAWGANTTRAPGFPRNGLVLKAADHERPREDSRRHRRAASPAWFG